MADYPNSIASFRDIENRADVVYDPDKKTTLFAEDVNALRDEVVAIETTLGTDTGLVTLSSLLKNNWTDAFAIPVQVRRTGNIVEVFGQVYGGNNTNFLQLPTGYRPQTGSTILVPAASYLGAENNQQFLRILSNGQMYLAVPGNPSEVFYFWARYPTPNDWPE